MKKSGCLALLAVVLLAGAAWAASSFLWDANTESDLAGYRLYVCPPGTLTAALCRSSGIKTGADIPKGTQTAPVPPNSSGKSVVTAFDASGNESGPSNMVSFTGEDTIPPAPPQNFRFGGGS